MFEGAGAVESARVIVDRATGRSKGFGFVEMTSDEDAQKAISSTFDGQEVDGRKIRVSEAKPQEPRTGGGGGGGRGFGGGGGGRGGRY